MGLQDNLKTLTPEQAKEYGKKGGIKSGEVKRKKKAMKETLGLLLELKLKPGKDIDVDAIRSFAQLKGKNITVETAVLVAQIQKALKGDTQAATFVRDTSGEKPSDNLNVSASVSDKFCDIVEQLNDSTPDDENG